MFCFEDIYLRLFQPEILLFWGDYLRLFQTKILLCVKCVKIGFKVFCFVFWGLFEVILTTVPLRIFCIIFTLYLRLFQPEILLCFGDNLRLFQPKILLCVKCVKIGFKVFCFVFWGYYLRLF